MPAASSLAYPDACCRLGYHQFLKTDCFSITVCDVSEDKCWPNAPDVLEWQLLIKHPSLSKQIRPDLFVSTVQSAGCRAVEALKLECVGICLSLSVCRSCLFDAENAKPESRVFQLTLRLHTPMLA